MISDSERAYLVEMRALTTDAEGREVLVGLTFEETLEYLKLAHTTGASGASSAGARYDDGERYLALHDKHELARLEILGAEHQKRVDKPTVN